MTTTRLIDASPVTDAWQLLRIAWQAPLPGPGQWLWLELAGQRCCLPIRDGDAGEGWIAGVLPGACLPPAIGPGSPAGIGALHGEVVRPAPGERLLLLGADLGIGPALALAERYPRQIRLALLGGHYGLPARLVPSRFFIPALADAAIAGVASLEQAGVPARIALDEERPGVHAGSVMELLGRYLADTPAEERRALRLIAFGPWGEVELCRNGLAASLGAHELIELPGARRIR